MNPIKFVFKSIADAFLIVVIFLVICANIILNIGSSIYKLYNYILKHNKTILNTNGRKFPYTRSSNYYYINADDK